MTILNFSGTVGNFTNILNGFYSYCTTVSTPSIIMPSSLPFQVRNLSAPQPRARRPALHQRHRRPHPRAHRLQRAHQRLRLPPDHLRLLPLRANLLSQKLQAQQVIVFLFYHKHLIINATLHFAANRLIAIRFSDDFLYFPFFSQVDEDPKQVVCHLGPRDRARPLAHWECAARTERILQISPARSVRNNEKSHPNPHLYAHILSFQVVTARTQTLQHTPAAPVPTAA